MYLDNTVTVEIPEGIDIHAETAGPIVRGLALAVDLFHRTWMMGLVSLVFVLVLDEASGGFLLIAWFLLDWFYPVVFEVWRGGQTPGKKTFNLVVVNDDLTPIRFEASVIRNLLRVADFLPAGYLFGLASMVISKDFKRLGDLAAGTLVVHKQSESQLQQHKKSRQKIKSEAYPLPVHLSQEEQAAVVSLMTRQSQLAPARVQELADLLTPMHHREGEAAVERLFGYGRTLLGDTETVAKPDESVTAPNSEAEER